MLLLPPAWRGQSHGPNRFFVMINIAVAPTRRNSRLHIETAGRDSELLRAEWQEIPGLGGRSKRVAIGDDAIWVADLHIDSLRSIRFDPRRLRADLQGNNSVTRRAPSRRSMAGWYAFSTRSGDIQ